jgi:hypothetical protein
MPVTIHDPVDSISDIVTGTGDALVKYIGLLIDALLDLQKIVIVFLRSKAVGAILRPHSTSAISRPTTGQFRNLVAFPMLQNAWSPTNDSRTLMEIRTMLARGAPLF